MVFYLLVDGVVDRKLRKPDGIYHHGRRKKFRWLDICYSSMIDILRITIIQSHLFIGTLKGFDQTINCIIDDTHERVYSSTTGVEQVVLGLHIVRGDNIAIIGELDEDVDQRLDLSNIKAEPVMSIIRWSIWQNKN